RHRQFVPRLRSERLRRLQPFRPRLPHGTIQSLTLGNSATLNLIAGAPLTVAGSATLGGALNVSGIANGQPNAILMSYPAETGAFANAHLPGGDTLQFAAKQVSLV